MGIYNCLMLILAVASLVLGVTNVVVTIWTVRTDANGEKDNEEKENVE